MGRNNSSAETAQKTRKVLFMPKHIKSKDKLLTKYKKPKKQPKYIEKIRNSSKLKIITKSAIDNSNQCLPNRYLIFYHNYLVIKIDLKTMKTTGKDIFKNTGLRSYTHLCAIPNQKYFGIDYSNSLILTINENLKILERKSIICPMNSGTIIYLDGLIYLLGNIDGCHNAMIKYDLNKERWKKLASITPHYWGYFRILATFEGKILAGSNIDKSLKAYDPFCNSFSEILKLESSNELTLLVANDKVYCIQSDGYIFESLPRDCTQWICIGINYIEKRIYGKNVSSFYNGSIYFIGMFFSVSLFEFNLKTRNITFVDNIF